MEISCKPDSNLALPCVFMFYRAYPSGYGHIYEWGQWECHSGMDREWGHKRERGKNRILPAIYCLSGRHPMQKHTLLLSIAMNNASWRIPVMPWLWNMLCMSWSPTRNHLLYVNQQGLFFLQRQLYLGFILCLTCNGNVYWKLNVHRICCLISRILAMKVQLYQIKFKKVDFSFYILFTLLTEAFKMPFNINLKSSKNI